MNMADCSHDSSSTGACEPLLDNYSADYPIRNVEDGQLRGCVYSAYNAGPRSRKDTVWSVSSLHSPALQLNTCEESGQYAHVSTSKTDHTKNMINIG